MSFQNQVANSGIQPLLQFLRQSVPLPTLWGLKRSSQSNPEGLPRWNTHYEPRTITNPFFLEFYQLSLKKAFPKSWFYHPGFNPSSRFFRSLCIWHYLWGFKGASQSNPEWGSPLVHPICTESNEVEPYLKLQNFYNVLLKKSISQTWLYHL